MKLRSLLIGTVLAAATMLAPLAVYAAAPSSRSDPSRSPAPSPPTTTTRTAPVLAELENPGFEDGLEGWQFDPGFSDVAIVPKDPPNSCFLPEMPTEGNNMACLSTSTFFGGAADGDVRSDLTSGPITFPFRPASIKISFDVDFQTEEPERSIGHNDAFEARLVTNAGTFPIVQLDTFGRTLPGRGLRVEGFEGMQGTQSDCQSSGHDPFVGIRTGHIKVTWTKPFDPVLRATIARGPVFVDFTISGQGDATHTSIVCIDDVQVKVTRPSSD